MRRRALPTFGGLKRSALSLLSPSPERRAGDQGWPLHDDKAGALEVRDQALCDDRSHDLVGGVHALIRELPKGERGRARTCLEAIDGRWARPSNPTPTLPDLG